MPATWRDPEIGRFYQTMQERINAISTDAAVLHPRAQPARRRRRSTTKLEDPALAHYAPWLRDTRAFRPHQLSDELEKLLHEKYVAGRAAWVRLFDETIAELRFPIAARS